MGVVVYLGANRFVRGMRLLFPGSPSRDLLQVRRQLEQTATWTTLTTFSNSSRLELTHTSVFRNVRQCLGGRTTRINNHVSCLFACHDSSVECQYDGCIRKDAPSSRRCIRQFGCIRYWRLPVAVNASKYRLLFPPPPLSLRTYPLQYIECILCLCRLLPVVPAPLELNRDELGGSSHTRRTEAESRSTSDGASASTLVPCCPLLPCSTRPPWSSDHLILPRALGTQQR